jgi:hypothetical protein
MKIIALDLGLKTGFAMDPGGGPVESGFFQVSESRGESRGMRFLRWGSWLRDCLDREKPDLVIYEQPHCRGGAANDVLVGMATRVQEYCAARGIQYGMVHSMELKKWATKTGKSKKPEMIAAAVRRAGRSFNSEDEAEAWLILAYAKEKYGEEGK